MFMSVCLWQVRRFSNTQEAVSYKQLKQYASRESTPGNSICAEEVSSELQLGLEVLNQFNIRILQNTYVLWAETHDLSWAFHVFKSMNETGLELTDTDKLKALVVACWSMESKAQETQADEWDQCITDAGGGKNFRHVLHMMAYANGMPYSTGLLQYMVRSLPPPLSTFWCSILNMPCRAHLHVYLVTSLMCMPIFFCVMNCRRITTPLVVGCLVCLKTNQTTAGSSWRT